MVDFHPEGGGIIRSSTLRGHGNTITDISFHEQQVNLIATAAFDNFVYVWDTRTPRKPSIELSNFTWTNRACWERISGKNLGTSHDGIIKIWDIGKTKTFLSKRTFTFDFQLHFHLQPIQRFRRAT